jgi:hypothetical protein
MCARFYFLIPPVNPKLELRPSNLKPTLRPSNLKPKPPEQIVAQKAAGVVGACAAGIFMVRLGFRV